MAHCPCCRGSEHICLMAHGIQAPTTDSAVPVYDVHDIEPNAELTNRERSLMLWAKRRALENMSQTSGS